MKKVSLLSSVFLLGFAASASAADLSTNQTTSCQDAKSIEISVATISNAANPAEFGYTSNDRGTASLVVWKSSNFTTVPITLGPNDSNKALNSHDHVTGLTPMGDDHGRNTLTLTHQTEFSRGDSIGDISGLVKITNTGPNPVTVNCQ